MNLRPLSSIGTMPLTGLLLVLTLNCGLPTLSAEVPSVRLTSTFLQLTPQHKNWTQAQWSSLFDYFHQLKLSEVIVQWTVNDDTRFYATADEKPDSSLDRILAGASGAGLKVWVGLYSDSEYWSRIAEGQTTSAYLSGIRVRSLGIAQELMPLLKRQTSFAGWYLPEEIDDSNWQIPEARKQLLRHVGLETGALHELTPGARIAISTFTNARISPAQFRDFWTEAFHNSALSTVLLQDGIGVHKLELNEFPLYAAALAEAARSEGRDFAIVVELFQQTGGLPVDSGPFQALPAAWERVHAQLEIAHRFTACVAGFSVPDYMTPLGMHGAEQLYADYLKEYGDR